jgi:hypothetical protein
MRYSGCCCREKDEEKVLKGEEGKKMKKVEEDK